MVGAFEKQLKKKVADHVPHFHHHKEKSFLSENLSRKSFTDSKSSINSIHSHVSSEK